MAKLITHDDGSFGRHFTRLETQKLNGILQVLGTGLVPDKEAPQMGEVIPTEPASMTIRVRDFYGSILGNAVGDRIFNPDLYTDVTVSTADSVNPRIDLVVIAPEKYFRASNDDDEEEVDSGDARHAVGGRGVVKILKGTPAADPVPVEVPKIQSPYIVLAEVRVNANATSITADDITDKRDFLIKIEQMQKDLQQMIIDGDNKVRKELYAAMAIQKAELLDEIAAGDAAVRAELDNKIAEVNARIDDVDATIADIQVAIQDLNDYVQTQIANLTNITDDLQAAVAELQDMAEDTAEFKQRVTDRLAELEGEIVANQKAIQDNLNEIKKIEAENLVSAGKWEQRNAINSAKNTFRISVLDQKSSGTLQNGFYDVFKDDSGIDTANSQDYVLSNGYVSVLTSTSELPSGCVALWKMDTGYGGIAKDFTESGHDGIIHGASWIDGKYGKALSFDGNDYVALGNATTYPIYGRSRSIAVWFKSTGVNRTGYIFGLGGGSWANFSLVLLTDGRVAVFGGKAWSYGDALFSQNTYNDGNWHFAVFSYDSSSESKILNIDNGAENLTKQIRIYTWYSPNYCRLGAESFRSFPVEFFRGAIDEVVVFNRVLTDDEIASIYTHPLGVAVSVSQAIVQSKVYTASVAPNTVMVIAEDTGNVTYEVSRDGGTTWTAASKNIETDISAQPSGTSMILKATIPAGEKIDNWALLWS